MTNSISPLVLIAGPTAAGKSTLALYLAERFDGEIVNGDSLQLYRGMDIGTAKPTPEERNQIPHHLFDVRDPNQVFTAGEFCRLGRECLRGIAQRGKVPMVVGGAGFYLQALLEGLAPSPERSDKIRERLLGLEARREASLHRILRCWDPSAAERIHGKDLNKLIRALEIILLEKKALSAVQAQAAEALSGFRYCWLGLEPPREQLRDRIALRTEKMFQAGFIQEVLQLRESGFGPDAKAMESVGYKQAHEVIEGKKSEAEAIAEVTVKTRQYAKRQMTWFRRNPSIHWLSGFGDSPSIQAQARSHLEQFLKSPIKNLS